MKHSYTGIVYTGIVRTPSGWWVCLSKQVYDAHDLPDGHHRNLVLSAAEDLGLLRKLGPLTMSPEQVLAAAAAAHGTEVTPDQVPSLAAPVLLDRLAKVAEEDP